MTAAAPTRPPDRVIILSDRFLERFPAMKIDIEWVIGEDVYERVELHYDYIGRTVVSVWDAQVLLLPD